MANWKNKEFNDLRRAEKRAWQWVVEDTQFREKLYELLLTQADLIVEHPKLGRMYRAKGHPDLRPLILERIRKLLGENNA